ncbi:MAG: cytidylate kinase-like family protein [Pirellulales bacterium]
MEIMHPLGRSIEGWLRSQIHGEGHREGLGEGGGPPRGLTIALSREVGAGGTTVAREIGSRLGWPVYDQELVEQISRAMNVRPQWLEELDERRSSWLEECFEAFARVPTLRENVYCRHLIETLFDLAARGNCVIVGRGAAQVLPASTTLRVRLLATLEDRVRVMGRELNLSPDEAASWIATRDRERIRFVKDHFRQDPSDPQGYDLVVNTSRFAAGECAELVIRALEAMEIRVGRKASAKAAV